MGNFGPKRRSGIQSSRRYRWSTEPPKARCKPTGELPAVKGMLAVWRWIFGDIWIFPGKIKQEHRINPYFWDALTNENNSKIDWYHPIHCFMDFVSLCFSAVSSWVFASKPSLQIKHLNFKVHVWLPESFREKVISAGYMYIYIYMCVCVCVCICVYIYIYIIHIYIVGYIYQ